MASYEIESGAYQIDSGAYVLGPIDDGGDEDPDPEPERTYVASFDDQSFGPWSNDTGQFGFSTGVTEDGAAALRSTGNGWIASTPGDGLPNYFERGNVMRYYARSNTVSGSDGFHRTYFGFEDTFNRYQMQINFHEGDNWFLLKRTDGGGLNILDDDGAVSGGFAANTWYEITVAWDDGSLGGSNGDITMELREAGSSTVKSTLTANDTDNSGAGVGCNAVARDNVALYWDSFHLNP